MTKAQAKREVCSCVAQLIDTGHTNEFLGQDKDGNDLSDADRARMEAALEELVAELRRRAGEG